MYALAWLARVASARIKKEPVLQRYLSNLTIVLGCIAFAVVGLGPRGGVAALCIGGGHGPADIIVARTLGGGHAHGPSHASSHASTSPHHDHACEVDVHLHCGDEHHTRHHHHGAEHGPCADIPLDQDEYRGGSGGGSNASKSSGKTAADAHATLALTTSARSLMPIEAGSPVPRGAGGPTIARAQIIASLRTVILQV